MQQENAKVPKPSYFFKMSRVGEQLEKVHFDPEKLDKSALNLVVYGVSLLKYDRNGKSAKQAFFYLHEKNNSILQWVSNQKESRLDLSRVVIMSKTPTLPCLTQNNNKNQAKAVCLPCFKRTDPYAEYKHYLSILSENKHELVLQFTDQEFRDLYWQGLQEIVSLSRERRDFGNPIVNMANKLFVEADLDGNQVLSKKEIRAVLRMMHINMSERFFNQYFNRYDNDNNGMIDQEEFQIMTLNLMCKQELQDLFKKYSQLKETIIVEGQQSLIKDTETSIQLLNLKDKRYSKFIKPSHQQEEDGQGKISLQNLQKFFLIEQEQHIELDELAVIVDQFGEEHSEGCSFYAFVNIIFNDHNTIIDPQFVEDNTPMNRPLSDYFIFSSHNTYLMANQLTGLSSVQAYRNAFAVGCKCVEIDCWDGETEPIVTHGHTLTSKILFKDVIRAVKEYGFIKSPYPVILSLELHCTTAFQIKIANILRSVLNDQLYTIPEDFEEYKFLPSPDELKYKVIVKGKGKLSNLIKKRQSVRQSLVKRKFQIEDDSDNSFSSILQQNLIQHDFQQFEESDSDDSKLFLYDIEDNQKEDSFHEDSGKVSRKASQDEKFQNAITLVRLPSSTAENVISKPPKVKIHVDDSLLSCYGMLSTNFQLDNPTMSIWEMCSINENKLLKLLQENPISIIKYHTKYLTRIYPKASRISSSNFSSLPALISGAQMCALNIQTYDDWMVVYKSQFIENSYSGYILKPHELRYNNNHKDSIQLEQSLNLTFAKQKQNRKTSSIKNRQRKITKPSINPDVLNIFGDLLQPEMLLVINFISGQQISAGQGRAVSPYLEVELKGLPVDEELNPVVVSEPVKDNGYVNLNIMILRFNPIFNQLVSFTIFHPWYTTIFVKVLQKSSTNAQKLAQAAFPIRLSRNGYRVIQLENERGKQMEGSYLLVQIRKKPIKF